MILSQINSLFFWDIYHLSLLVTFPNFHSYYLFRSINIFFLHNLVESSASTLSKPWQNKYILNKSMKTSLLRARTHNVQKKVILQIPDFLPIRLALFAEFSNVRAHQRASLCDFCSQFPERAHNNREILHEKYLRSIV